MNNLAKLGHARKRRLLLLPLLLGVMSPAAAQGPDELDPAGASLAGATSARIDSPWFALGNAAMLTHVSGTIALLSGSPPPTAIPGLYQGSALLLLPFDSSWHAGFGLSGGGVPGYREVGIEILAATTILPNVGLGVGLPVRTLAIERYGAAGAVDVTLGLLALLTPSIRVGGSILHTLSPPGSPLEPIDRLAFGTAIDVTSDVAVSIDVAERLRHSASVAIGISGTIVSGMALRAGISSSPAELTGGFSYDHGALLIDYAALYRLPLGIRHLIGIGVRW